MRDRDRPRPNPVMNPGLHQHTRRARVETSHAMSTCAACSLVVTHDEHETRLGEREGESRRGESVRRRSRRFRSGPVIRVFGCALEMVGVDHKCYVVRQFLHTLHMPFLAHTTTWPAHGRKMWCRVDSLIAERHSRVRMATGVWEGVLHLVRVAFPWGEEERMRMRPGCTALVEGAQLLGGVLVNTALVE